jgi:ABC-2 type transport system permease protein
LAQAVAQPLEVAMAHAEGIRPVTIPGLESPQGQLPFGVLEEPDLNARILKALQTNQADAIVLLSESLVQDRATGKPGAVGLFVEGSRPQLTAQVRQAVLQAAAEIIPAMENLGGSNPHGVPLPSAPKPSCPGGCAGTALPDLQITYLHGGAGYRLVDFFLPTLLPFFVFFFTFMVSTITFQRERTRGTLERIMIAPVHLIEVVAGYVLGFSLFSLVQVAIVMAFVLALITFPVTLAQVAALVTVCVLVMLISLAIGLVVSFNARSEFQAVQFVPLVILPQIFLGDLIWTLDGFPAAFRWFAQVLPLTHANAITRALLLRHESLLATWPHLLALIGMLMAACLFLAWEGRLKGGSAPEG